MWHMVVGLAPLLRRKEAISTPTLSSGDGGDPSGVAFERAALSGEVTGCACASEGVSELRFLLIEKS